MPAPVPCLLMPRDEQTLVVSDEAVEAIKGIRSEEPDADDLALTVAITGVRNVQFVYELTFIPVADAGDDDVLQRFGDLPVVVRADSVERLEGATITIRDGGLAIDNPNSPSPEMGSGGTVAEGPVADRIRQVLEERINPAIASHGGFAELVAVEGETAYLRMGGGCQGCGLAQVTLSQGIEVAITDAVPEITNVVDVTDHASGDNPYYESSKK
jgi:Fe/S biogenesis protein NfuA